MNISICFNFRHIRGEKLRRTVEDTQGAFIAILRDTSVRPDCEDVIGSQQDQARMLVTDTVEVAETRQTKDMVILISSKKFTNFPADTVVVDPDITSLKDTIVRYQHLLDR